MTEATLALTYWQQRIKDRHFQLGDIPSKILFNRLRQKKQRNFVYMLRNQEGEWVDNSDDIGKMIRTYFQDLYQALPENPPDNRQSGEAIDLVLRELNLPRISSSDSQRLSAPITD